MKLVVKHVVIWLGYGLCATVATAAAPTLDQRQAAAQAAAVGSACGKMNFYWEIGDAFGNQRSGNGAGGTAYTKVKPTDTESYIASAGKWLYGAYVLEKSGTLDVANDKPFLNMTSGYSQIKSCAYTDAETVGSCGNTAGTNPNNPRNDADQGKFFYNPGHFEAHAALDVQGRLQIKDKNRNALAAPIASALHIELARDVPDPTPLQPNRRKHIPGLRYSNVVLAGGAMANADTYTQFLRQILNGTLKMRDYLDPKYSVCASTVATPSGEDCSGKVAAKHGITAAEPPLPNAALDTGSPANGAPWRYSLGHWIEKDGTYSSAGAFGFYPWIDQSKTWYGVVARYEFPNILAYQDSAVCGRAIRNAWLTAKGSP